MEKQFTNTPGDEPKLNAVTNMSRDDDLGQVLDFEVTPGDEKKVLRKLDIVYGVSLTLLACANSRPALSP
jgi:hypothetical protein